MNFKSTFALLLLAAMGGAWFWFGPDLALRFGLTTPAPNADGAGTARILETDLTPEKLTRIEVKHGKEQVVLEKGSGSEWSLPGKWPTRQAETQKVVGLLTGLRSRFVPFSLGQPPDLKPYGLDPSQEPVVVAVQTGDRNHRLTFGEGDDPDQTDPFLRPTFLRLDEQPEVLRLAPGLMATLKASRDYYQKHRLFPTFAQVKIKTTTMAGGAMPGMPPEVRELDKSVELFNAQELAVQGPDSRPLPAIGAATVGSMGLLGGQGPLLAVSALEAGKTTGRYTLKHLAPGRSQPSPGKSLTPEEIAAEWELAAPARDRPEEKKLEGILTAVPNIWAERFTRRHDPLLVLGSLLAPSFGLEGTVTPVSLWAGVAAWVDTEAWYLDKCGLAKPERTLRVTRTNGDPVVLLIGKRVGPEKPRLFPPPPESPLPTPVEESYRYAKLQGNDQIFEIKDKVEQDVFVPVKDLRDSRLVRFRPEDARRVVIAQAAQEIDLVKEKGQWQLRKPLETAAESAKVIELLDKLSNLEARGDEVVYHPETRHGFANPKAMVRVEIEDARAEGKTKTIAFELGNQEAGKVFVRVQGWPRIGAVEDSVLTLVKRPALAYRNRRVFDFVASDLARIDVRRGEEKFVFQRDKGTWSLAAPVPTSADATKTDRLVEDLGRLEAVEYVTATSKPEDLDKLYGLAQAAVSATVTFSKGDRPAATLVLGKQRGDKPEYFAKLASAPAIFAVKKEIHDLLDQGSLAYRPSNLWNIPPDEITEVRRQKDGQDYRVQREGQGWRIVEPFQAAVKTDLIKPMVDDLANLKTERYETHKAKDLAAFGLDKPSLRVTLGTGRKASDKPPAEGKTKEHVLLIGKPTAPDANTRFAKLGEGDAIFVVNDKLAAEVERSALDFLDRQLLVLDSNTIQRVEAKAERETWKAQRERDGWQVETPAVKFVADREEIEATVRAWSQLKAARFAAYGEVDAAFYGLDKPTFSMTVSGPAIAHTLVLGKPVPDVHGAFYAQLDKDPGVAVLPAALVHELKRTYLDFVDRTLLQLEANRVTAFERQGGAGDLEIVKGDNGWNLLKPAPGRADGPTLDSLVADLATLRAQRIAAYPAGDLKEFGLDPPAAVVTLRLTAGDDKPAPRVLRIGKAVAPVTGAGPVGNGGRFAMVENSKTVAVISGELAGRLLASSLQFRDRNLARFAEVDRVRLQRGPRTAVFTKVDGTWKLTSPLEAEAEHNDLEDFINLLARLRADQLVAEKPADLKPYGLDKPEARWLFQSGDKDVLGLLVGAYEKKRVNGKEESGPRCYARLTTGDLVFLLDPRLTARALGEYRGRSVWASFDAAQVEGLHYGYARNAFALEKQNNTWQVAGKPDMKIESATVSETLDALARLRAERYVVDKDADFKLYGLEPPLLALDILIPMPAGKRTLRVGRTEGTSKRYYARVVEGSRSEVFLLSEADAGKIVRDVKAFGQPPLPAAPGGPPVGTEPKRLPPKN